MGEIVFVLLVFDAFSIVFVPFSREDTAKAREKLPDSIEKPALSIEKLLVSREKPMLSIEKPILSREKPILSIEKETKNDRKSLQKWSALDVNFSLIDLFIVI